MKLFRYTSGHDDKFAPAVDEKDAYERRAEVDPTFHFLPVQIEELTVEGYEITLTPIGEQVEMEVSASPGRRKRAAG